MRRFIITLVASSIILASPAKADSTGAIVGGVIGGMMLGAMAGAAAQARPAYNYQQNVHVYHHYALLRVRRILIRLIRA